MFWISWYVWGWGIVSDLYSIPLVFLPHVLQQQSHSLGGAELRLELMWGWVVNSFYLMILKKGVDLITGFWFACNQKLRPCNVVQSVEVSMYVKRAQLNIPVSKYRVQFNPALDFSFSPPTEYRSSTSTVPVLMPYISYFGYKIWYFSHIFLYTFIVLKTNPTS